MTGSMEYRFDNKTYVTTPGELMFIPKGSNHQNTVLTEGECECILIAVDGDLPLTSPCVYSLEHFIYADYIYKYIVDHWNYGIESDKFLCISKFYELLAYITKYDNIRYPDRKKFSIIQPAIEYLKHHINDTDLRINELHNLCGVSHTYFRSIFVKETGFTPKEYIIEKRLLYAKLIIENGEMESVSRLASTVGYTDPLYFSKAFKNRFGISPSRMNSADFT